MLVLLTKFLKQPCSSWRVTAIVNVLLMTDEIRLQNVDKLMQRHKWPFTASDNHILTKQTLGDFNSLPKLLFKLSSRPEYKT